MSNVKTDLPVDDTLTVTDVESVYRTEEWWKAVVKYYFQNQSESSELAIYLWHNDTEDDDWTRKNKYVIKTGEAWQTDRQAIRQLLHQEFDRSVGDEYPVSDYYSVAAGTTVSKENGWWKAILNVTQKGSYETDEVMIYLWQRVDGTWRRRQKYTVKSAEDWERDRQIIDSMMSGDGETPATTPETDSTTTTPTDESEQTGNDDESLMADITDIADQIDKHLTEEYNSQS